MAIDFYFCWILHKDNNFLVKIVSIVFIIFGSRKQVCIYHTFILRFSTNKGVITQFKGGKTLFSFHLKINWNIKIIIILQLTNFILVIKVCIYVCMYRKRLNSWSDP